MNTTYNSGQPENQRGDDRFPVSGHCNLRGVAWKGEPARITDLSCGGARLEHRSEQPWRVPRNGTFVIELPRQDTDPLRLFALPIWSNGNALGVKFLLVDDMDRLALAEIIDESSVAA